MTLENIKKMTLAQLVELFTMTGRLVSSECYIVRGWLMDAIEEKNPEGFSNWLDSENCDDAELAMFVL